MHEGNGEGKHEVPRDEEARHESEGLFGAYQDIYAGISKYAHCSNASYVIVLIYLDRLQEERKDLILNQYCVHK